MVKNFFPSTMFFLILLSAGYSSALENLSNKQMKDVYAQSGLSIAVSGVVIHQEIDSFSFTPVDARDIFGNTIANYQGYVAIEDFSSLIILDSEVYLDAGLYQAPNEHLSAIDIGKQTSSLSPDRYEHMYVGDRIWGGGNSNLQAEPYYWPIGDEMPRPIENYAALRLVIDGFDSTYTADFNMRFCDLDLSHYSMSGISSPEYILNDTRMPNMVVTAYPEGSSINMELRTRLSIGEIKIGNRNNLPNPDLQISGIHLGEAFATALPDHLEDTGNTSIDASGWGTDHTDIMYSGYFLLGNVNQVDFDDTLDEMQLYRNTSDRRTRNDDNLDLVGLTANPLSINIGKPNGSNNPSITLSTGINGSIRVESLVAGGRDMGPAAVDGIRVKHCVIDFPGEYKNPDGSYTGRIHPTQMDWLNK